MILFKIPLKQAAAVLFLLSLLMVQGCTERKAVYRKTRPLMDTLVTVTVVSENAGAADKAIGDAFAVIEKFGDSINFFSEKSELSEINRKAGIAPVRVSPATLDVIEKAVFIAKKSGGAFDPTIGIESRLWDFATKRRPSDQEIARTLALVNYRDIVIDKAASTVFLKRRGMMMDLGAIAKGYAADLAVDQLRKEGIKAGIVANAGDIRCFGSKPDGKPWNVGIENPRHENASDEIFAEVQLSDKAISTSGDYERYFIENGKRYHHILDPKTGYPAIGSRSVSIITDKGVYTDAFSTAIFVLGPEKGMKVAKEMGLDAVIIDSDGKLSTTPGIKGALKLEKASQ